MDRLTEVRIKEERVQQYLSREGLDALVLARHENFAWLTGGGSSRIVSTEEAGPVYLVLTRTGRYAVTNISEARRTAAEELDGLGYELMSCGWHESVAELVRRVATGRVASDVQLPGAVAAGRTFQRLRYALTAREQERYRWLCRVCAEAVTAVCRAVDPGETEQTVAGLLAAALAPYGVTPSVVLVAADERISRYRHPIPTARPLERYLMVVLVGEKWGLHSALTRFVHFGPIPGEIQHRLEAAAAVHTAFHSATRPGAAVSEIFRTGLAAYAAAGFADEWQLHHQGGAIGYAPREYLATAESDEVVAEGQPFAWNPSVTGAKCEDTILATAGGAEVLTATADWPQVAGHAGILER